MLPGAQVNLGQSPVRRRADFVLRRGGQQPSQHRNRILRTNRLQYLADRFSYARIRVVYVREQRCLDKLRLQFDQGADRTHFDCNAERFVRLYSQNSLLGDDPHSTVTDFARFRGMNISTSSAKLKPSLPAALV